MAIDRLHIGYLGCFGNTWLETRAFDRLAAQSLVLHQVLIDSTDLAALYRSLWQGRHALRPAEVGAVPTTSLSAQLAAAGYATTLLTDEPRIAEWCDEPNVETLIVPVSESPGRAAAVDQTHVAELFAAAIDVLAQPSSQPRCLWLHCASLGKVWDAPTEYCERFTDPEDAATPALLAPPHESVDPRDPDAVWGLARAYAAQVAMVDAALDALLDALAELQLDDDTLLAVVGLRGIALGEHGFAGCRDDSAANEMVAVPWLIRWPGNPRNSFHSQALVQPPDLYATLAECLGAKSTPQASARPLDAQSLLALLDGEGMWRRDRALVRASSAEWGIRTRAWYMRHASNQPLPGVSIETNCQLFAKPDDFWDRNDVATRLPEVVDELEQAYCETLAADAAGAMPAPLSSRLNSTWH